MRKNLNKTKHDEHFSSVFVLSFLDLECGFLAVACTANYGAKEPAAVDKQLCGKSLAPARRAQREGGEEMEECHAPSVPQCHLATADLGKARGGTGHSARRR